MVLDIVETLECPALIGRIYNSHVHEDRTLPFATVTLTDVHALHRVQSRYVKENAFFYAHANPIFFTSLPGILSQVQ